MEGREKKGGREGGREEDMDRGEGEGTSSKREDGESTVHVHAYNVHVLTYCRFGIGTRA